MNPVSDEVIITQINSWDFHLTVLLVLQMTTDCSLESGLTQMTEDNGAFAPC